MREQVYLEWIKQGIVNLNSLFEISNSVGCNGCFFYPFAKKEANYVNARWQEAVYSLAWAYKNLNYKNLKDKIIRGINFWLSVQNNDGSFTEYSKNDKSFSATAFSLYAVIRAINLLGMKNIPSEWSESIKKASDWLLRNNEFIFINQEMAASLALLYSFELLNEQKYLLGSRKKLNIVLKNQSGKGNYKEKLGLDFGYSTLTLQLLAQHHKLSKDKRILFSADKFFELVKIYLESSVKIKNSRDTDWVIAGGFEYFAKFNKKAEKSLSLILEKYECSHLDSDKAFCTDLYRLCEAYDDVISIKNKEPAIKSLPEKREVAMPPKILNLFRGFGLHKLRRIKYLK